MTCDVTKPSVKEKLPQVVTLSSVGQVVWWVVVQVPLVDSTADLLDRKQFPGTQLT